MGGPSASLIDVFSAAEHACNTFLAVRMAAQVSLRLKFLDMLEGVCVQYLDTLAEHAAVEHRCGVYVMTLLMTASINDCRGRAPVWYI